MVRFCAKDSLWSTPVMKYFIRNSGAVPVYRSKDHGEKAKELNLEIFAKVIAALREGDCLGFAPEGVSRFLPYMEQPLKTGVARIAIDAVEQAVAAGQAEFAVQIVPVGLIFTHREKFRSDLCMRYRPAIVVDAAYLKPYGGVGSLDVKAAAVAITTSLNDALEEVTINAPDWETTRLAMTSARLHHPRGSDLTLGQYLILVRGWVEVLKSAPVAESADGAPALPAVGKLRAALAAYQDELDHRGIKCERVRRASIAGQVPPDRPLLYLHHPWSFIIIVLCSPSLVPFVLCSPSLVPDVRAGFAVVLVRVGHGAASARVRHPLFHRGARSATLDAHLEIRQAAGALPTLQRHAPPPSQATPPLRHRRHHTVLVRDGVSPARSRTAQGRAGTTPSLR
jgi:1-acyl-sn-glycerol-3-phosphate acyltransferase